MHRIITTMFQRFHRALKDVAAEFTSSTARACVGRNKETGSEKKLKAILKSFGLVVKHYMFGI